MRADQINDQVELFLDRSGLSADGVSRDQVKDLGDGTYAMIRPLLFHWMMIRGDFGDLIGYFDRWCYADEAGARAALNAFPEHPEDGYEPSGWHRHPPSGRRRPEGDPTREYQER